MNAGRGGIETVVGTFHAVFDAVGLCRLHLPGVAIETPDDDSDPGDSRLESLGSELRAYLAGDLRDFSTPLAVRGTPFQAGVWKEVAAIPYGAVTTYFELATRAGGSARAAGGANAANPVPILVPCHRVVGSDRRLTGYAGGLELKRWLLEMEGAGGLFR